MVRSRLLVQLAGRSKMINAQMPFMQTLSFDDVLLAPKYSEVESRFKDISLTTSMGNYSFNLPIISSPMDTVTEDAMAITMATHGGLGVVHRYNSIQEQSGLVGKISEKTDRVAAAIGVSDDYIQRAGALYDSGAKILCVDVAHGHHSLMRRALGELKQIFAESVYIIAGNIAMPQAFLDLSSWGADAIRVGIGGGSICSTRIQTGHGVPTFQSIVACYIAKMKAGLDTPLIADGGIRSSGDIVKSLAAGADFAMLGSVLAATSDTPGETFVSASGDKYKVYRGMASAEAQQAWRGRVGSKEGVSTTIPFKGPTSDILLELDANIRSGLSYSGAKSIITMRDVCEFVVQTSAGLGESRTHIMNLK